MRTSIIGRVAFHRMAAALLLAGLLHTNAARAEDKHEEVRGTIVSVRGNILVVRPTLRPVLKRVAFGDRTELMSFERASLTALKPGMRVEVGGRWNEQTGLMPFFIEAADKPMGSLKTKTVGVEVDKQSGFAHARGTLKSVEPFVLTDDAGKDMTLKLSPRVSVWHDYASDRNSLLIGTRMQAGGMAASDGVIQADYIAPDHNYSKNGTMFGDIVASKEGLLTIRPRYTSDTIEVHYDAKCPLLRQINIEPERINVGDTVTFWGEQRNRPWDNPKSDDLKAVALLLGDGRYPKSEGQDGGVYLTGKIASLDPVVHLQLPDGKTLRILITAQMPICRLELVHASDLKPGAQVMLVLSRRPDNTFDTDTVVLDASPFVGYGG